MKTKRVLAVVFVALMMLSVTGLVSAQDAHNNKARFIVHTDRELAGVVASGCEMVRDAKTMKAVVCPKAAADYLGLQEDVMIFAMDADANKQTGADIVQASGYNGDGRVIVVLDTGYNYNHPELTSSYLGGRDFVNNDSDPMDDNGHGTHVAGIITADGVVSKAKGVAPNAGIIAGKVLDSTGSGYFSDLVAAVYWAADNNTGNTDAISMSLGTGSPYTYRGYCDSVLPDMTKAVNYAVGKGIAVVVAAGNSGNSGVSIPGCIRNATTVGAVDRYDNIAKWSGRGSAVDITAPGVSIYSSWLGNNYATLSGTSMATPMVSGAVALIKSAHPTFTVAQVEDALFRTAEDLGKKGWDSSYGWGRLNVSGAMNYARTM